MVELNIKPRLGYVTFTYTLGLTTEYRVNFRDIYRAVEPLNHITLTEELLSCQATKIICLYLFSKFYSFTSFFMSVLYRTSSIKLPWEQRLLLCGMSWLAKSSL